MPGFARETYLEALVAVVYAARLATGTDVTDVAGAARSAPIGPEPLPARQLLLLGLAARLTDGYAAAAPLLKRALHASRDEERQLDWLCVPYNLAAMDLWTTPCMVRARVLADRARARYGALSLLPYALDYLAENHILAGDLPMAAGLLTEAGDSA